MGGEGGGTNPEELFAVGYAACFESALGAVARRRKVDAGDVAIDSKVSLYPNQDRGFELGVELDVTLPSIRTTRPRSSWSRPRSSSAPIPTPLAATSSSE
jgi:lipoyl-dependent peroxiredoxin